MYRISMQIAESSRRKNEYKRNKYSSNIFHNCATRNTSEGIVVINAIGMNTKNILRETKMSSKEIFQYKEMILILQ